MINTTTKNIEDIKAKPSQKLNLRPQLLVLNLLNKLKDKEKEVLIRRFGLLGKNNETLEQIGTTHGLTRERIRQIETNSLKKLRNLSFTDKKVKELEAIIVKLIAEYGGLTAEDFLLDLLFSSILHNKNSEKEALLFVLNNLLVEPKAIKNHSDLYNSWHLSKMPLEKILKIIYHLEEKLKNKADLSHELELTNWLSELNFDIKPAHLKSYLAAAKRIQQNQFGKWGLVSWRTIVPRRVSDKIYLIFKEIGKHLHFREIADLLNQAVDSKQHQVNLGTVHNELIMDDRYVLLGRGIYGLKEWGYASGTVSDIIKNTLNQKGPLTRHEVVAEVLKQRMVKPSTVRVVLTNKKLFKKDNKNKYSLVI